MTLEQMMEVYDGRQLISISGYCEEATYDYYTLPEEDEEDFSGNNPNNYIPSCMARTPWWNEAKDLKVKRFTVLSHPAELYIELER